ncbi:hypothetical protein [Flavobacterium ustbae]|nr:hypothetical protein [Flavobacterium ustbae]
MKTIKQSFSSRDPAINWAQEKTNFYRKTLINKNFKSIITS